MFNLDMLIEQAKDLFAGETASQIAENLQVAEDLDVAQLVSDAGLDLETLAQTAPDELPALLEQAGLDPGLLEEGGLGSILGDQLGEESQG